MKIVKKIIFIFVIFLVIISISYLGFYFYFKKIVNNNILKNEIHSLFTEKFNKAVYFEKIYLDYHFDLIVKNIKISNNDDFNDENILLDCPTIVLRLDKKKLLKNDLKISKIILTNSKFNFQKSYDISYKGFIKENFKFLNSYNSIFDIIKTDIIIKDSVLSYLEYYKEGNAILKINISNAIILKKNNELNLNIDCSLSNNTENKSNSDIKFNSKIINDNSFYGKIISELNIKNYNLSNLNTILFHKFDKNFLLSGYSDNKINFILNNNVLKYNFTTNFKSFGLTNKNMDYMLISKLFMNLKAKGLYDIDKKYFEISGNNFINEDNEIKFSYIFNNNKNKYHIKTNKINLNQISNYITPYNISDYSGNIDFDIGFINDVNSGKILDYSINILIENLNINKIIKGKNTNIFNKFNSKIKMEKSISDILIFTESGISDCKIVFKKYPVNQNKINFKNDLIFTSKNFEFSKILYLKNKITSIISDIAEKEKVNNYNEIFFQERELGKFLNSRNFKINFKIDNILFLNNKFKNMDLSIKLENGKLKTEKFNLEGFDGIYSFEIKSNLYSHWPLLEYEFNADNINLEKMFYEIDEKVKFSGNLSVKEKYSSNFYRSAHLLENAYYTFSVDIYNSEIYANEKVKIIDDFFKTQSREFDFKEFKIINFNYNKKIIAEVKTINRFNIATNLFNFRVNSEFKENNFKLPIIVKEVNSRNRFNLYLIHSNDDYIISGENGNNIIDIKKFVTE